VFGYSSNCTKLYTAFTTSKFSEYLFSIILFKNKFYTGEYADSQHEHLCMHRGYTHLIQNAREHLRLPQGDILRWQQWKHNPSEEHWGLVHALQQRCIILVVEFLMLLEILPAYWQEVILHKNTW
jgi:hypothetical protein